MSNNVQNQLAELINEYFAAKETAEAARALVIEFMEEHGVTNASAERGKVSRSNGYEKMIFDASAFEKAHPEAAAEYQRLSVRKPSYQFRAS